MPSPFPGMDPWLEDRSVFPDLHDSLIFLIKKALNDRLPPGYFATAKTIVWIDEEQRREPDVSVTTRGSQKVGGSSTPAATLHPTLYPLGAAPVPVPREEGYVEIYSLAGRRLVTAIEVLSLSNKAAKSEGRKAYRRKQREFASGRVNVVEIDLLRGGTHTTAVPLERLEWHAPGCCYHVCSSGRAVLDHYIVAAVRLADRLPRVPIPLDPGVPPLFVELQPLLDRAYDTGRYARHLDYDYPLRPALSPAEQAWANDILSKRTPTRTESEPR